MDVASNDHDRFNWEDRSRMIILGCEDINDSDVSLPEYDPTAPNTRVPNMECRAPLSRI